METAFNLQLMAQHLNNFDDSVDRLIDILALQSSLSGASQQKIHMSLGMWNHFCNTGNYVIMRPFLSSTGNHAVIQMDMSVHSWTVVQPYFDDVARSARIVSQSFRLAESFHKSRNTDSMLNGYLNRWEVKKAFLRDRGIHVELDTPEG